MKFLLAAKKEMTRTYVNEEAVPVTVLSAPAGTIIQVKTKENDGYEAIQVGFGKKRSLLKPQRGHVKEYGTPRWLREFRCDALLPEWTVGAPLSVAQFAIGDTVTVTGTSRGRGFAGVVRRHGFRGGPRTHGHKDNLRAPGSIGAGGVQHVFKGMRMGGHMGNTRVTVKNLPVIHIDVEKQELWVKGAVPGHRNSLLMVRGV